MPIISTIGRRHLKTRALIAAIYLLLAAGAVTMIYPFLLMLAGTTKSPVDGRELSILPAFFHSDAALYRKHIEGLFNESLVAMQIAYGLDTPSFEKLDPPPELHPRLVAEWQQFQRTHESPWNDDLGYIAAPLSRGLPSSLRLFKAELARRFGGEIEQVNRALGTEFVNWNAVAVTPESYLSRREKAVPNPFMDALHAFKSRQPLELRYAFSVEGLYKTLFLKTQYTREIDTYNKAHGTRYASYRDVHLSRRYPAGGTMQERADWEQFVRSTLNLLWIRADPAAAPLYRRFLKAKYREIAALNKNYAAAFSSFDDPPFPSEPPSQGIISSDWESLLEGWKDPGDGTVYLLPVAMLEVSSIEFRFRDWLGQKYGSIDSLNSRLDTRFGDFAEVLPPQQEAHYLAFVPQRAQLRWEFATRNYRAVLDFMLLHGRGVVNTLIYCGLAVACALIFNPLAAYALSRYKLPSTYKVLLFLLLTMAFPAMVTQIPVFLMLRKLNLLNSFAALILPGLVSGFSIFLLKGFFDSLPRELYETATLDGASEWTIFWQITMRLSTPVLAVIALGAFTGAYSNFLFALLICQDEKMWTLMVWLYQLQQRSGPGVIYASLAIAAVPMLVIFIFAQNVIMRGIVVPVEK